MWGPNAARSTPYPAPKRLANVISHFPPIAYLADMLIRALLSALTLVAALPAHALTQDDVVSARLLSGWQTDRGTHMAALELALAPGWKTYWRAPGDAGIPPSFDFSASTNLKSVRFHWPRPAVFDLNGMQTIGYHDHLVLPIEVTPEDPAQPVTDRKSVV